MIDAGTPENRRDSVWAALREQEDYLRSEQYLSDEELLDQLKGALRVEKARINEWLDSGDCFIVSGAGKVHLPSCGSMRQFMDRDTAWRPYLDDLERVRDWHGSDNAPPMPALKTRAQVEALPAYAACPMCAPALDHPVKRRENKGWATVKAGSLKSHHFGTAFSHTDGTELGALQLIATAETAEGLEFRAEFDGTQEPVTDPATELMYQTRRGIPQHQTQAST